MYAKFDYQRLYGLSEMKLSARADARNDKVIRPVKYTCRSDHKMIHHSV